MGLCKGIRLPFSQLISKLSAQPPSEVGPIYTALHKGGLAAAIGQMMQHELSSSIILALLELCMAKRPDNYTGGQYTVVAPFPHFNSHTPYFISYSPCSCSIFHFLFSILIPDIPFPILHCHTLYSFLCSPSYSFPSFSSHTLFFISYSPFTYFILHSSITPSFSPRLHLQPPSVPGSAAASAQIPSRRAAHHLPASDLHPAPQPQPRGRHRQLSRLGEPFLMASYTR